MNRSGQPNDLAATIGAKSIVAPICGSASGATAQIATALESGNLAPPVDIVDRSVLPRKYQIQEFGLLAGRPVERSHGAGEPKKTSMERVFEGEAGGERSDGVRMSAISGAFE